MRIILIAGLWLDGSAWDEVLPGLRKRDHEPIALTLPGQSRQPGGPDRPAYDDQVAAVVAAVDAATQGGERVYVVGHSAACTLAWAAADRRPEQVNGVAMIGGMPTTGGEKYAAFFPAVDAVMRFPGWEPFAGADSDDLDADTRRRIETMAVGVPESVSTGIVTWSDTRRRSVPVTMVCPEYSPEDAKAWVEAGDIPELSEVETIRYVDIESGHWPMFSKPQQLATLLADLAAEAA